MSINNVNTVSPMLQQYIQKSGVAPQPQNQPVIPQAQTFSVFPGSDLLKAYLLSNPSTVQAAPVQTGAVQNLTAVQRVDELEKARGINWKNNLMGQLRNNEATIMAVIPRTMNAKDIDGKKFTVKIKTGQAGKTFGSVTGANVADALKTAGYDIDKKKIVVPSPIKAIGEYDIDLKLLEGISAK